MAGILDVDEICSDPCILLIVFPVLNGLLIKWIQVISNQVALGMAGLNSIWTVILLVICSLFSYLHYYDQFCFCYPKKKKPSGIVNRAGREAQCTIMNDVWMHVLQVSCKNHDDIKRQNTIDEDVHTKEVFGNLYCRYLKGISRSDEIKKELRYIWLAFTSCMLYKAESTMQQRSQSKNHYLRHRVQACYNQKTSSEV